MDFERLKGGKRRIKVDSILAISLLAFQYLISGDVLNPGFGFRIGQLLSIKENICPERPRKSHALQDAKKYFFLYITRKMRSTAFQPCITLGGLHWDEMGQKHDFLKKNALKTAFLGDTILDRLTSEGVGSPKKIKNATLLMLSFNDGP